MKSAKKEKITITPSPRIDYCGACGTEHGYDCPKDKKEKVAKPKVSLISYSMKMVIPTGNYANIQPEIIVKAGTVEEAHDYIAPHFNKLWKEYYLCGERRPEVKPVAPVAPAPAVNQMPPASSVAFTKASQAIASCMSMEALDIIQHQIENSVKLTQEDKPELLKLSAVKAIELNGKVNPA